MTDNGQYRIPDVSVRLEYTGKILVTDNVTRQQGLGATFSEAVEDYHKSLVEWELLLQQDTAEGR